MKKATRVHLHVVNIKTFLRSLKGILGSCPVTTHLTFRQLIKLNKLCDVYGVTPSTIISDMIVYYIWLEGLEEENKDND